MARKLSKPKNRNPRVQNKPWDVPPQPQFETLDSKAGTLYEAVGRSLTTWETVEEHLASLFSVILGHSAPLYTAVRAYGSIQTFRGRNEMLTAAAEAYFERHPHKRLIVTFDDIVTRVAGYAARRNDIAHGKVIIAEFSVGETLAHRFILVPPRHSSAKIGTDGHIAYVFNSAIINEYEEGFSALEGEIHALCLAILKRHSRSRPSQQKSYAQARERWRYPWRSHPPQGGKRPRQS